ncbi:MAG TPA: DUF3857 domain-containing protein [Candidatus Angelobacter sp.]
MRSYGNLLVFFACLLFTVPSWAQKEDWLPITRKDLETKEVPGLPGAPAIQLYYADYIDDREQTEFFYHRIKVLNEKGNRYADVEILVPPDASLDTLKARTIHPDGAVVEFTGKPFQKIVLKERGLKVMTRAFTFPEVTVGSIIEYKFKISLPGVYLDNSWTIQHELYTVKESFRMEPFGGLLEGFEKGHQVAALSSHMPNNLKPRQKNDGYELEVENMPPFEAEGHMPPEDDYKPQIRFFYGGTEIASTDKFWQDAGRKWNDEADRFIGKRREIAEEAARVIGGEADPLQKLRKLYARAQQIRNLTYERERTEQEEQKENLKPNQNAGDVLAHGYGNRDDVGRFFVALARAAGFTAAILRVSDRSERFFDRGLLSRQQLGSEIALVTVGGQDLFLDPGTRFCPFGFVRWMHTSSLALELNKDGGTFIKVPAAGYNLAMVRRAAEMSLNPAGVLTGTITVTFEGGEALERRLDALATDEAGRKKELEDEAVRWLPSGASAKLLSSEGWEGSDAPLVATFAAELPSYASVAGKRLLVPTCLFLDHEEDVFNRAERKYPVYFPYAFGEADTVTIQLPPDYTAESVPPQQSSSLSYATYLNDTEFDGKRLVTHRVLQVNGIFFRVEIYPEVKDFFRKVQLGDEQRMVIQPGKPARPGAHAMEGIGTVQSAGLKP